MTVLVLGGGSAVSAAAPQDAPVFETDIRPILAQKCGKCHGTRTRRGELDLSSVKAIRRGGESGEPLLAGTLTDSLLWTMIEEGEMPPDEQPALSAAERELIRRWVHTGGRSNSGHPAKTPAPHQHDVLPIVLLRCVACHGPQRTDGGLDLRTPALMRKGGRSGPALVPGNPDGSPMIRRIESEACPPRASLLKFFVRRPPATEVQVLRKWIAAGAPELDIQPDVAGNESDPLVPDEDRRHWAFVPPQARGDADGVDDFIVARLQTSGLELSAEADRDTLIRRAYLDLTGIPPDTVEWQRWRSDRSENWYAQMIDHLLASPRYGERWGRYWLDVAGYADSEGGVSADPIRDVAWKYRDYVIRAFNADKPYDRFLVEQIAGDELVDFRSAAVVTPEMVENLVATGFLRMGIDQTGSRTMNYVPERLGVIDDAIRVLGSGVMGLTLECARCHSHKYDAIPHRDYYRFKAILQGAMDEHDWLTFKNRKLNVGTPEQRQRVQQTNPPLAAAVRRLESQQKKAITELRLIMLREHYPLQSEQERQETIRALRIADNNRTQPQRVLVELLQRVEVMPPEQQPEAVRTARRQLRELEKETSATRRRMEPPLAIRALWDRGQPSPTYILRRGEHHKPGRLVGPGIPSVLTDGRTAFEPKPPFPDGTPTTGRRLALAKWLTSREHPLTARVMVNRVWYHHFGQGLVSSLENFGVKGAPPSHPELLDWLAVRFIEDGWSIKQLHRTIMNSRTYRQSSRITDNRRERDPQNLLLSRMPLRRLDAEALRDSLLFVSGMLNETPGGPPDVVSVDHNGLVSVDPGPDGRWRRSVYAQLRRTEIPSMMATFDYPEMGPNCLSRSVSTVSPQSLMLMHNANVRTLARALATEVTRSIETAGEVQEGDLVDAVYHRVLTRLPSPAERDLGIHALEQLTAIWDGKQDAALETYCHTILNSAAFLYVD